MHFHYCIHSATVCRVSDSVAEKTSFSLVSQDTLLYDQCMCFAPSAPSGRMHTPRLVRGCSSVASSRAHSRLDSRRTRVRVLA